MGKKKNRKNMVKTLFGWTHKKKNRKPTNNPRKATNLEVTQEFLDSRNHDFKEDSVYPKQKWIIFCETLMARGYSLSIYEARKTFSKYITATHPLREGLEYKVRFSNHKPIKARELRGDCDYFVGVTNTGTRTYKSALRAVEKYFSYPCLMGDEE